MNAAGINQMAQMGQAQNIMQEQAALSRVEDNSTQQNQGTRPVDELMQNIAPEQREVVSQMFESLDSTRQENAMANMEQLDENQMSQEEYANSLMEAMSPENTVPSLSNGLPVYA